MTAMKAPTMENKGHTPGPWAYDPDGGEIYRSNGPSDFTEVAAIYDLADAAEQEANAAFIVRAVNSHYEMLEALKACRLELDHCQRQLAAHGQTGAPNDSVSRALAAGSAAIARATEGGA